ncbi:MAG: hypothetical protein PHV51_01115 [Methanosarcinaceae archaeon]|nr:hypothetical protein [Methanosarcinaceae archaeon]
MKPRGSGVKLWRIEMLRRLFVWRHQNRRWSEKKEGMGREAKSHKKVYLLIIGSVFNLNESIY